MKNCEMNIEKLSALLDNELPNREKTEIYAHMDSCPDCRRVYDAFIGISDAMPDELLAPPAKLVESIMQTVVPQEKVVEIKKRENKTWRHLAAAACFVLVCYGAWQTGFFDPSRSGDGNTANNERSLITTPEITFSGNTYDLDLDLDLEEGSEGTQNSSGGGSGDAAPQELPESDNGLVSQFNVQKGLLNSNFSTNAAFLTSELERLASAGDIAVYHGEFIPGNADYADRLPAVESLSPENRTKLMAMIAGNTLLEYNAEAAKDIVPYCTLFFTSAKTQDGQGHEDVAVTVWIVDGWLVLKIGGNTPALLLSDALPIDFEEFLGGLGF